MKPTLSFGLLFLIPLLVEGFTLYDGCLFECLNCVESWGKNMYDGKACAQACIDSKGRTIDRDCTGGTAPSRKRTELRVTSEDCEERCEKCVHDEIGLQLNRLSCIFTCLVKKELPKDC